MRDQHECHQSKCPVPNCNVDKIYASIESLRVHISSKHLSKSESSGIINQEIDLRGAPPDVTPDREMFYSDTDPHVYSDVEPQQSSHLQPGLLYQSKFKILF